MKYSWHYILALDVLYNPCLDKSKNTISSFVMQVVLYLIKLEEFHNSILDFQDLSSARTEHGKQTIVTIVFSPGWVVHTLSELKS